MTTFLIGNLELDVLNIVLILLSLIFLIILIVLSVIFSLKYRKWGKSFHDNNVNKQQTQNDISILKEELKNKVSNYEKLNKDLEEKINIYISNISSTSHLSKEEAKELMMNNIESFYKEELSKRIDDLKSLNNIEIKKISSSILVDSMEQIIEDVLPQTFTNVKIDEDMKGRIIGKEGRIIKAFENITNVDLRVEKDSYVSISSFNPLRREIAQRTLKKILQSRSIDIPKIESSFENESKNINEEIINKGKLIVVNNLNLEQDIPEGLYYYIGRLEYRHSFSQSVLTHSLECAHIAEIIAEDLGIDSKKSKIAAFLHDIGKSIDFEEENNHVQSGVKLAKKYNMPEYVINAIGSHHDDIPANNIYSAITKIADIISSSRPGVRKIDSDQFFERLKLIEKTCLEFDGVKQAFVIKSGKQVRIIIDPSIVDDAEISILGNKIEERFSNDASISIRPVDIILIRESRFETKSKTKKIINNT